MDDFTSVEKEDAVTHCPTLSAASEINKNGRNSTEIPVYRDAKGKINSGGQKV